MSKIKTDEEYREKIRELNKEGGHITERASERQKHLEGETADYAQKLHRKETKGRPRSSETPLSGPARKRSQPAPEDD